RRARQAAPWIGVHAAARVVAGLGRRDLLPVGAGVVRAPQPPMEGPRVDMGAIARRAQADYATADGLVARVVEGLRVIGARAGVGDLDRDRAGNAVARLQDGHEQREEDDTSYDGGAKLRSGCQPRR